jgi:hypothetical protein
MIMTVADIMEQAKGLTIHERNALVKLLIDTLDVPDPTPQKRRLSELRGLGKEIKALMRRNM